MSGSELPAGATQLCDSTSPFPFVLNLVPARKGMAAVREEETAAIFPGYVVFRAAVRLHYE